jgi:hypothetical protein
VVSYLIDHIPQAPHESLWPSFYLEHCGFLSRTICPLFGSPLPEVHRTEFGLRARTLRAKKASLHQTEKVAELGISSV